MNSSAITAIANNYGFDVSFARQLDAYCKAGDVLRAISTGGDSLNVLNAVKLAKDRSVHVVGMTGAKGDTLSDVCDVCLRVPSTSTPRIQECIS